jgi:hypothetical protein
LDNDLGFCMWLAQILSQAGIRALPTCRTEEALEMCAHTNTGIDLIIVNPEIEGSRRVLRENRGAKVIAIGPPRTLAVDATLYRPIGPTLPATDRYLDSIRAVLGETRPN